MKHIKKSLTELGSAQRHFPESRPGRGAQHHRPFWFRQVHPAPLRHEPGNRRTPAKFIKNGKIGLVFQNFNLFPHFSVIKNIADAPIKVQKRDKKEVYAQARELLKKMGLSDKENYLPLPAFRWTAAESFHCQGFVYEPGYSVFR